MLPQVEGSISAARASGPSRTDAARQWPAFDGVRAIAVLAVVAFHATYPSFIKGGYVGVDVFFVLSGFLITWLLTSEHDQLNAISYPKFYARRALRLFPALAALIVASLILVEIDHAALIQGGRHETLVGIPFVIFYVGNWNIAFGATLGLLGITWTLAIEEQYYLLWPLTLSALLKRIDRRRIAALLVAVALAEEIVRYIAGLSNDIYFNLWFDKATVTHSDGLLLGSALALMWTTRATWKIWPTIERRANEVGMAGAVLVALAIVIGKPDLHTTYIWETVAAWGTVLLVMSLVALPTGWISRTLALTPLQWIGKRSYGMYIWHFPIIILVLSWNLPHKHLHFTRFALEIVITFVVTALSYKFIEQPFLRRKARFARVHPDVTPDGDPATTAD